MVSRIEDGVEGGWSSAISPVAWDHPLARAEASQPGIISFVRRRRRYARGVEQAEPETGASTTQPSRRGNHLVAP